MPAPPVATYPDLAGKVAVVTGGSKGIGAATCRALVANQAAVVVVARQRTPIDALVDELSAAGGRAIGVQAHCDRSDSVEAMRERVEAELGPVDVLVPFAGGFNRLTPVADTSEEEWRSVIDSNLTATFLTVRAFLPSMVQRGRGAIVTMASNAGRLLDIPLTASYAAAKAGVIMFTRHLALEAGPAGVRANCVAPATTLSDRIEALMSGERIAELARLSPLGRVGRPEDTANATLFLASEASSWLTGITIDVAGGRVML